MGATRQFETGATRDTDQGKYDYEGFLSPLVLERYAAYMHQHRKQSDGHLRDSDNWQRGIPKDAYMKSGWRHFMDWWKEHRGHPSREGLEDALMGLLFNVMGYAHEVLKANTADSSLRQERSAQNDCGAVVVIGPQMVIGERIIGAPEPLATEAEYEKR